MSLLIANGQLPTALTTALATATQSDYWSLRLRNTSSSVAQVVTLEVKRNGGTARTLPGSVTIPVSGSAVISGIPMESNDSLFADTTTATTVDYDLTGTGAGPGNTPPVQNFSVSVFDGSGVLQTSGTAPYEPVYSVAAGGTAIGNATALSAGNPSQFSYISGANNAAAALLPVAVAGEKVTVKSTTSGSTLQIFPQVGSKINGAAANAVYNVPNLGQRVFTAVSATQWYTDPETIV